MPLVLVMSLWLVMLSVSEPSIVPPVLVSDVRFMFASFAAMVASPLSNIDLVAALRSEEHTSELQSLMRISYAVFCLKKKKIRGAPTHHDHDGIKRCGQQHY